VLGIGGSTSDVLRKAPKRKAAAKSGRSKKAESGAKGKKGQRKRHERRVDLRVKVPKEVRQALRTNAKARGTSVDEVVTVVLEGWIEG
jgi:predicted HicB family RNase H-like nuclease